MRFLAPFLFTSLALAAPAPAPAAKDYKMLPTTADTEDLGLKTGKIGVDKVDLSRLRVDPVKVDVRTSTDPSLPDRVVGPDVRLPSPHLPFGPRDEIIPEPKYIPRWRKDYDAGARWMGLR